MPPSSGAKLALRQRPLFCVERRQPGTSWPATSATVVAVGGASKSEAGSGISSFVLRPSYQASVASIIGNMRAVPDIATDANRETGAWVLDSGNGGWYVVGA